MRLSKTWSYWEDVKMLLKGVMIRHRPVVKTEAYGRMNDRVHPLLSVLLSLYRSSVCIHV